MIADRRSQIAIRSAIVCDHMETYFCDRLRSCDRDRRRSQKIERSPAIVCDPLRSIAIVRSYGNQSFAICDRNASHNISGSLPRFNARVNGLCSKNHFVVIWRNLWRKLLVMNVFTIAAEKILKTRTKGQLLGQNRAEVLFMGRGSGGQISQHKNRVRSLSNPKPMFSTVLELTTTRFMTKRRSKFACGKISALPRSRCCLLFSLHARVYLTFPLTKTYGYGRLCDRCNYMETAFFAIVCDCLRSAIVCDRLRLYGNQPLDRTWFYLLRSSAITIAGSQTIAEVFPYDRRPYCDLRSAICDPRSYGNQP